MSEKDVRPNWPSTFARSRRPASTASAATGRGAGGPPTRPPSRVCSPTARADAPWPPAPRRRRRPSSSAGGPRRLHAVQAASSRAAADRVRRREPARETDVHRGGPGARRRHAGHSLRRQSGPCSRSHRSDRPDARRRLYRERHQVPAAGETGTRNPTRWHPANLSCSGSSGDQAAPHRRARNVGGRRCYGTNDPISRLRAGSSSTATPASSPRSTRRTCCAAPSASATSGRTMKKVRSMLCGEDAGDSHDAP